MLYFAKLTQISFLMKLRYRNKQQTALLKRDL